MWWLIVAHFISDWGLQSRWMAENKSKYWEVLLAHSFIYAGGISIALEYTGLFSIGKVLFILIGHFITDYFSSRGTAKLDESMMFERRLILYVDHFAHFCQLWLVMA